MSDRNNWFIVASNPAVTRLTSDTNPGFDLFNEYALRRVVYNEREYGINLGFADLDTATPSLFVVRQAGGNVPINYREDVAIGIRDGGYLRYASREYGINLKFSESPVWEWRFTPVDPLQIDTPVQIGQSVGLFNTTAEDWVFYDPRQYGINLKWLADKGKFNGRHWYEAVSDFLRGIYNQIANLLTELVYRIFNILEFVLTFLGIMFTREIRIRIVILRNSRGQAVFADEADPDQRALDEAQITKALGAMKRCLDRMNVNLVVEDFDKANYKILPLPAPGYALNVRSGGGALRDDLQATGRYFRDNAISEKLSGAITIFVVNDVEGTDGSGGMLRDYVVVEPGYVQGTGFRDYTGDPEAHEPRPTTPMHVIGHACGLFWHQNGSPWILDPKKRFRNLMKSATPRGVYLNRLQMATFRSSRHLSPWVANNTTGTITNG